MATDPHRSSARSKGYLFRLSAEDRDELRRRAQEHGLSVQAYLEMVALGRENPEARRPGPTAVGQKELFSMTG